MSWLSPFSIMARAGSKTYGLLPKGKKRRMPFFIKEWSDFRTRFRHAGDADSLRGINSNQMGFLFPWGLVCRWRRSSMQDGCHHHQIEKQEESMNKRSHAQQQQRPQRDEEGRFASNDDNDTRSSRRGHSSEGGQGTKGGMRPHSPRSRSEESQGTDDND
ncbi:MAG: hypothetical protein WDO70_07585 [Alphaproteobacteria bacterium]